MIEFVACHGPARQTALKIGLDVRAAGVALVADEEPAAVGNVLRRRGCGGEHAVDDGSVLTVEGVGPDHVVVHGILEV